MDQFVLVGITHPGAIDLAEGLLSIGRNPTNDFRVPDATVSSFHCELIVSHEAVLVRDLKSTNGTFINDEPVQEGILKPWQTLRLGHAELASFGMSFRPSLRWAISTRALSMVSAP